MKRLTWLASLAIVGGFLLLGATSAFADDCVALGGTVVGTECQVNSTVIRNDTDHGAPAFNIAEDLRICGPGGTCAAPAAGVIYTSNPTFPPGQRASPNPETLTINVTGKFIMEDGGQIIGDKGTPPNN